MEIALSRHCSGKDIVTPLLFEDEMIRKENQGSLPQNFHYSPEAEQIYRTKIESGEDCELTMNDLKYYNHMPAAEIRSSISRETWDRLYKFTIERHPYEKAVSLAYFVLVLNFKSHRFRKLKFKRQLNKTLEKGSFRNFDFYSQDGQVIVDDVLIYENRARDFPMLEKRLGLEIVKHFPVTKDRFRLDWTPAAEILSNRQKERVYEVCKEEFETFGFVT